MKKQPFFGIPVCLFSVFVLSLLLTQTGCEEAKGVSGLAVEPATVTLSTNDTSVVLTVIGEGADSTLSLPLEWEVSDSSLGEILASSGVTAVYRRNAADGVNLVTVRDQFSREGFVAITQRSSD